MPTQRGSQILRTEGNSDKKAGALNVALSGLLPAAEPEDMILIQDADSQLSHDFIERAVANLQRDSRLGAVGGVFRGGHGGGFVRHLQRNEYARYARDVRRLKGRCLVVTGTAALFRTRTLRDVIAARLDGSLPPGNGRGGVSDTSVLTEDNELSFALLTLRYRIKSPADCTLVTEVMPHGANCGHNGSGGSAGWWRTACSMAGPGSRAPTGAGRSWPWWASW